MERHGCLKESGTFEETDNLQTIEAAWLTDEIKRRRDKFERNDKETDHCNKRGV